MWRGEGGKEEGERDEKGGKGGEWNKEGREGKGKGGGGGMWHHGDMLLKGKE